MNTQKLADKKRTTVAQADRFAQLALFFTILGFLVLPPGYAGFLYAPGFLAILALSVPLLLFLGAISCALNAFEVLLRDPQRP